MNKRSIQLQIITGDLLQGDAELIKFWNGQIKIVAITISIFQMIKNYF